MRWPQTEMIDGYIMRSEDVKGRTVGDLPRILGMDPKYLKECEGALYGLKGVTPNILPAISIVGFNNDRDPKNPQSFNRPPLMAGRGNPFQGPSAQLNAEMAVLYQQNRGMLIKFKFRGKATNVMQPVSTRFPVGAGIREYVLHRPTPFELIWTFAGSDLQRRVP